MRTHVPLPTRARVAVVAATAAVAAMAGLSQAAPAVGSDHSSLVDQAIAAARSHVSSTRFGAAQALTAVGTIVDRNGTSHVRLQRSYRGLPVIGGDLVVHQSATKAWKGVSQTLRSALDLRVTPTVQRGAAEATAAAAALSAKVSGERVRQSRLVVDATGAAPRLAWQVTSGGVQSDGTPSRMLTYVDAKSGALIRSEQQIETADGSGQSLYSGTVPLQLTQTVSAYQLKDPTRGNTYTTDMGNASDGTLCTVL